MTEWVYEITEPVTAQFAPDNIYDQLSLPFDVTFSPGKIDKILYDSLVTHHSQSVRRVHANPLRRAIAAVREKATPCA